MSNLAGSSNVENLSPQVLRQVAKEVGQLAKNPLEGVKVFPNEEDITDIQATVEGPAGTPYAGGYFKIRLVLGKDFPRAPPKGYFLTKVFHPNVAANGEICVNTLKKDWKADTGLKQLLLTIKCLLIYPNPESALNEEAGKLLLEQYEDYFSRAKMMTRIHAMSGKSKESIGSDPCSSSSGSNSLGTSSKKHAGEKKQSAIDKRKKDKKKNLKRL